MFNVALGWAFLLSVAASPGGKFLAAVFETSALRTIPSYQVALAGVFANYWVSTLLIYILLVATRAERFLKPSNGIHLLFGLANGVLCFFAAMRVFATTVEGGGGAFVLASFGALITVPALCVLLIATIWLIARSISLRTDSTITDAQAPTSPTRAMRSAAAAIALLPPFVFFGWMYFSNAAQINKASEQRRAKVARLDTLCDDVRIDIRRRTGRAKSVLFSTITNATYPLVQDLDFVELKQESWRTARGVAPYERLMKKPNEPALVNGVHNIIRQDVAESEAEYEISVKPIESKADTAMGIAVVETTIVDRRTNEVLAISTSVSERQTVVTKDSRFCPLGFEYVAHQREVPAYVLSLMDEKATIDFEKRLATLKARSRRTPQ